MTEEEFSALPTLGKWVHIQKTMDYIIKMDAQYEGIKRGFDLRRRLNPHHPPEDVAKETESIRTEQCNLRLDQYQRWSHIKNLYAAHRDELVNTFGDSGYEECKSILERIFTMELDDALRNVIDED